MTAKWSGVDEPERFTPKGADYLRMAVRGIPLALLVFGGLLVLLLIRLIERPFFGIKRPLTLHITQFVCRMALACLGIGFSTEGQPMRQTGAVVANHGSWLDIFALNARKRVYFVSKAEVANWPGIGWLARATGTVFINRDRRETPRQIEIFQGRLSAGHKLLFFPEGTSTDTRRILPFKSTLFAAFFTPDLRDLIWVQPVTVNYHAPDKEPDHFYGWWGDMDFASHLMQTLCARRQGRVELVYHHPIKVSDFESRKALAAYCENAVRSGLHASTGKNTS